MRRPAVLLLATALALGPVIADAQPRAASLRPAPASDEGGLWDASDRAERAALASADLNTEPALTAYVQGVACRVAAEYCGEVRVQVMDRPLANASMMPNGYTEVWSGLLLRVSSEAELAFVLGHETAHFAENHTVEAHRAHRTRSDVATLVSAGVAVASIAVAAQAPGYDAAGSIEDLSRILIDAAYISAVAGYFAFSRRNEAQADRLGFERAVRAGYAPPAAAALWRAQMDEAAHSDFRRVREAGARPNVFNSHPIDRERVAALDALARAAPAGGELGRERHRAAIRPHLAAWLKDELRRRDHGQTLWLIDRLAEDGEDLGVLEFYRGEVFRRRGGDGDRARALAAYRAASAHPDAPVAVWREVGDLLAKAGAPGEARAAYEAYLANAPVAQDRWLVEAALKALAG